MDLANWAALGEKVSIYILFKSTKQNKSIFQKLTDVLVFFRVYVL